MNALPLGVKIPKIGPRGFRSQKKTFPATPEKGALSQKIPISIQSTANGDSLTQSALFYGGVKWFFDSEPLFSRFWGFGPLSGANAFLSKKAQAASTRAPKHNRKQKSSIVSTKVASHKKGCSIALLLS